MGRAVGISCGCGRKVDTYLGRGFVDLLWEDDDTGILARLGLAPMREQARDRNLERDEFTLGADEVLAWVARLRRSCVRAGPDVPPFYRIWHRARPDQIAIAAPIFRLDNQHYLVEAHDTVLGIRAIDHPEDQPVVLTAATPSEKTIARWLGAEAMTAEEFDQIFAGSNYELERGTLVEAFTVELADIEALAEHAAMERHLLTCFHY